MGNTSFASRSKPATSGGAKKWRNETSAAGPCPIELVDTEDGFREPEAGWMSLELILRTWKGESSGIPLLAPGPHIPTIEAGFSRGKSGQIMAPAARPAVPRIASIPSVTTSDLNNGFFIEIRTLVGNNYPFCIL